MSLRSTKKITRRSWDMTLMPDTFIEWFNLSEKYQQEILVFPDCKGQLIGDGDVNITGVDGNGDEN